MHLRLALSRLPVSRMQSKIAAHIAALAETMRIFQCEPERQCDQRAYALDLLQQQHHLRITLLHQRFDALTPRTMTRRINLQQSHRTSAVIRVTIQNSLVDTSFRIHLTPTGLLMEAITLRTLFVADELVRWYAKTNRVEARRTNCSLGPDSRPGRTVSGKKGE